MAAGCQKLARLMVPKANGKATLTHVQADPLDGSVCLGS